ncbi:MAG: hypothetical protein PHH47_04075 [Gallionella sp.]|nr:hypothetical protein [Gallionella sp.]MDD4945572.1 hypothetical protein [Gallionella sp.]MDD5611583.1 hypothetical protein [Gallionella sp.]
MNIAWALMLALSVTSAWAMGPHGEIENAAELAAVPSYCKGTLVTRYTLPDPKPLQEYIALYGASFNHLHHYCWALNQENQLDKVGLSARTALYGSIFDNIQYFLSKAPDNYPLLPEIYLSKARIMFKFNNNAEAIEALLKLIQLQPAYAQAYAQLGDYYQRKKERDNAIKWYERGLTETNKRNADFFIWKLKKLDGNYTPSAEVLQAIEEQKKQESAAKTQENKADAASDHSAPTQPDAAPAPAISPEDAAKRPNPYCRFCP